MTAAWSDHLNRHRGFLAHTHILPHGIMAHESPIGIYTLGINWWGCSRISDSPLSLCAPPTHSPCNVQWNGWLPANRCRHRYPKMKVQFDPKLHGGLDKSRKSSSTANTNPARGCSNGPSI